MLNSKGMATFLNTETGKNPAPSSFDSMVAWVLSWSKDVVGSYRRQELADTVGKQEATRGEVIKQLWAYIKEHKLQDHENKQLFTPDKVMEPVYVRHLAAYSHDHDLVQLPGCGHLPMCEVPELLSQCVSCWLSKQLMDLDCCQTSLL